MTARRLTDPSPNSGAEDDPQTVAPAAGPDPIASPPPRLPVLSAEGLTKRFGAVEALQIGRAHV